MPPIKTPTFASSSNQVPKLTVGDGAFPHFLVNESLWRRSGSSYFGRFDSENPVDDTYTPINAGIDMIFGGTGFEIAGGSDLYVGTIVDSVREDIWIPIPACAITNFYVSSSVAPGGIQTYTFTVYKNTVAQSMQAVISGSGTSASYSGTITFSAGDKFSVRVQTSSTANTAYLTYSVRLE